MDGNDVLSEHVLVTTEVAGEIQAESKAVDTHTKGRADIIDRLRSLPFRSDEFRQRVVIDTILDCDVCSAEFDEGRCTEITICVLVAMQRHFESSPIQLSAILALWHLGKSSFCLGRMAKHGAIRKIINAMRIHSDEAELQEFGLYLLEKLDSHSVTLEDDVVKEDIAACLNAHDAVQTILHAMELRLDLKSVQDVGLRILLGQSSTSTNGMAEIKRSKDAVEIDNVLLDMESNPDSKEANIEGSRKLVRFSNNCDMEGKLTSKCAQGASRAMSRFPDNVTIQSLACSVLYNFLNIMVDTSMERVLVCYELLRQRQCDVYSLYPKDVCNVINTIAGRIASFGDKPQELRCDLACIADFLCRGKHLVHEVNDTSWNCMTTMILAGMQMYYSMEDIQVLSCEILAGLARLRKKVVGAPQIIRLLVYAWYDMKMQSETVRLKALETLDAMAAFGDGSVRDAMSGEQTGFLVFWACLNPEIRRIRDQAVLGMQILLKLHKPLDHLNDRSCTFVANGKLYSPNIILVMKQYPLDEKVQEVGCTLLNAMTHATDDARKEDYLWMAHQLCEIGAFDVVFDSVVRFQHNQKIWISGGTLAFRLKDYEHAVPEKTRLDIPNFYNFQALQYCTLGVLKEAW